jgi:thioester reductase-like protein/pimeloyl-ACP methyl ester carboxylesterase
MEAPLETPLETSGDEHRTDGPATNDPARARQVGEPPAEGEAFRQGPLANDPARARQARALPSDLRRFAAERLAPVMVPARFVVVDELPTLPNGKVDRGRLTHAPDGEDASGGAAPDGPAEAAACALWAELLGREHVDPEAGFFELGGTSLTAVRMAARWIADAGVPFDLGRFLEEPTVRHLVRLTGGGAGVAWLTDPAELARIAVLPPDVRGCGSPARPPYRRVLVTGGGGVAGAHLVRELLDRSAAVVHVLTGRGPEAVRGELRRHGLWRAGDEGRLVAVPGDLARPYLGLEPELHRRLSREIDAIVHDGGDWDPRLSFDRARPATVLGTVEVLRFACAGRVKPVQFVSLLGAGAASAAGVAGGVRQCRWAAERYLRQAAGRGIPTLVHRVGQVVAAAGLGDGFLAALLKMCVALRAAPGLDVAFSVTPAALLASSVADAVLDGPPWPGGARDVVAGAPVSWPELVSEVRSTGRALDVVPYRRWRRLVLETVAGAEVHDLTSYLPLIGEDGLSPALGYRARADAVGGAAPGRELLRTHPSRPDRVGVAHAGVVVRDHTVTVPLDHARPGGPAVEIFAQEVVAAGREHEELPWLLFLQGGPGAPCPRPTAATGWLSAALRHYRVLLLDQRGCGRSAPVTARSVAGLTAREIAAHLRHFRADGIVRDAEVLRARVAGGRPWSVLGQSYGGFVALTYLSLAPEGLSAVFVSGGLPGLRATADDVYARTCAELVRKHAAYYAEYPQDVRRIRELAAHLAGHDVRLPGGERLTVRRMRLLGRNLGMSDGFERAHRIFAQAWSGGEVSAAFRQAVAAQTAVFAEQPLYAMQEFAYARPGHATRWAAQRALASFPELACDADPLLLFGEMTFPWMFREITGLRPFADAAELLAEAADFPELYAPERLAANTVPVVALVYSGDLYTPEDLQRETAAAVGGTRLVVTDEFHHNGLVRNPALLERLVQTAREMGAAI